MWLALALFAASPGGGGASPGKAEAEEPPWVLRQDGDVKVYTRDRPGTRVQEVRATAVFDVDATTLHEVATDLEHYAAFFPFIDESTVLARGDGWRVAYQRSKVPMLKERDYIVRVDERLDMEGPTRVLRSVWSPGPREKAPPKKAGVIRVDHVEGGWEFRELGPTKSEAVYHLFTDPEGKVPPFLVNLGSQQGLPLVFAAVEREGRRRAAERAQAETRQAAPSR